MDYCVRVLPACNIYGAAGEKHVLRLRSDDNFRKGLALSLRDRQSRKIKTQYRLRHWILTSGSWALMTNN